jgi:hypothetical protein
VNREVRQDSTAADMIVRPAQALTLLSVPADGPEVPQIFRTGIH